MEPPKKRKFPLETFSSGTCGQEGVPMGVMTKFEVSESVTTFSDTVVVSSQVSLPAKRNRRSYSLEFKVAVLDSYYNDAETRLNQRKTALKYGVNRNHWDLGRMLWYNKIELNDNKSLTIYIGYKMLHLRP